MPPNSWRSPKVRRSRNVVAPIVQALTEELADDNNEAAVFAALGMRYETPQERQRWVRTRT